MARMGVTALVFILCAALPLLLFPAAGCGSASEESYERDISALSERFSVRLEEAVEALAEEHHAVEGERAAAAWSRMADLLEEFGWELSRVKVPAGLEELHSSLLMILRSISGTCREAEALLPTSGAHGEEGTSAHEEEGGAEHAGEGTAEHADEAQAEHGTSPQAETHEAPQEGHGH